MQIRVCLDRLSREARLQGNNNHSRLCASRGACFVMGLPTTKQIRTLFLLNNVLFYTKQDVYNKN